MPVLNWQGAQMRTTEEKARALYKRFYLRTGADLGDILDSTYGLELALDQTVTYEEVYNLVRKAKPDKCPGQDEIPYCFLQLMGEPLVRALQALIAAVIKLSYFLARF
jgi:hypothetical protein